MNHSLHSADRSTHLTTVAIALCAAVALLSIGLSSRDGGYKTARVTNAGKSVMVTDSSAAVVR
jgi:hypothetical protein